MDETSRGAADPDEAAFQRLAEGLAALRRDADRLRDPDAGPAMADSRAMAASLAEIHHRIDAVAARVSAPGDFGPILAALAAVEEKIRTLTTGLDRFVERGALTEALAKADAKIDLLAARLAARLNRLQDLQAERNAALKLAVPAPGAVPKPPAGRSHAPALLLLAVMLIGAAGALAWLRPDLLRTNWVRQEWVNPARDAVQHWLRLSQVPTGRSLEDSPKAG